MGKYCFKIGSGATPRGGASVYLDKGKYSLIRSQNIYNEGFKQDGIVYIDKEAAEKLNNVTVEKDDVLINITGDSVARVCLAPAHFFPARVNQHVAIIRPNRDEYNPCFLRYYLITPQAQNELLSLASSGATRNALTKGMLENIKVPKPDIKIQDKIATILTSLDDKIELNQKTNQTLEEMAQAIFKEWFVDFRFPGHEKVKFIDGLPEGWRERNLGDFIDATIDNRGKTPPVIERNTMSYPLVEVNAIVGGSRVIYLENARKYVSAETYKLWFRKGHPVKNDTLVSTVGSIGEIGIVGDENISIAQNIVALRN
ncbi:MAG: restriction endonuclease subunit S, partial [Candidatus Pacebacteria bacterium]|nr:restriction endonuclease subunit S [Candidatus Paceibacterota bacterium]